MKYSIDKNNNPFSIQAHYCAAQMLMEAFTHNMEMPRSNGGEPMFSKEDLERIGDAYVAHVMRIVEITEECATPIEKKFVVNVEACGSYEVSAKSHIEAIKKGNGIFNKEFTNNSLERVAKAKEVRYV